MKIEEIKGQVDLVDGQLKLLEPIFEFLNEIPKGKSDKNVMYYIADSIEKRFISNMIEDLDSRMSQMVTIDKLHDKISIFVK